MKKLILAVSAAVILSTAGFAHAQATTCDSSTPGAVFQPDSVTGGGTYVCPAPTPCGPSKGGDFSCPSGQTCRVDGSAGACVATPVITCGPSKGGDYSCPTGMTCKVDGGAGSCVQTPTAKGLCGPSNGGNYSCPSGQTCRIDGNVGTCVSTPVATGLCGPSNGGDYSCPSGQTCRIEGNVGTCVSLATDSASSGAPSGYVPVVTIPGLTDAKSTLVVNQGTLANFLNNLYKYLIGIAAILAVIEIMWGGILISTQRDSISSHSEGRKKIEHAIGGLALVLLPALVFSIINPGILNLSVNLPALDIKSTNSATGGPGGGTPQASTSQNGVTQSVSGTYLQTAQFGGTDSSAINAAMDSWVSACNTKGGLGAIVQSSSCGQQSQTAAGTKTCTAASAGTARCSLYSSDSYTFVNAGSAFFGSIQLRPLSASAAGVASFMNVCRTDGGIACAAQRSSNALNAPITFTSTACTEAVSNLPGNASGKCYQGNLFCSIDTSATQCAPNTQLTP